MKKIFLFFSILISFSMLFELKAQNISDISNEDLLVELKESGIITLSLAYDDKDFYFDYLFNNYNSIAQKLVLQEDFDKYLEDYLEENYSYTLQKFYNFYLAYNNISTPYLNSEENIFIYTPKGTKVEALTTDESLSYAEINNSINFYEDLFPNAELISNPDLKYNCHSFAWYNRNYKSNNIWINTPESFIDDGSYKRVSGYVVNRIVVFYKKKNQINLPVHSAIIIGAANSKLILISKWGEDGLYRHSISDMPYEYDYYEVYQGNYSCNNHSMDLVAATSELQHLYGCNCGEFTLENHNFVSSRLNFEDISPMYVPVYKCSVCKYISYSLM